MTLRNSSSDKYANSHDNFSWTVPQFADSRQNPKYILSPDSFLLRLTVAPAVTAVLKTTYNKVAGQLLSRLLIAQALTALQKIEKQILHSVRLAHLQPFFQGRIFLVGLQKSNPFAIKTCVKKLT